MTRAREIYFHEDDFCQQQLLPIEVAESAEDEMKRMKEFANSNRHPAGVGWTGIYVRKEMPVELHMLKLPHLQIATSIAPVLPLFDEVYTGYGSHREPCKNVAAWGLSDQCALLIQSNEQGIVEHVWTEFFARESDSIDAATQAVAAIARHRPLIYVDWAWGYLCDASDEATFSLRLHNKLDAIAKNSNPIRS